MVEETIKSIRETENKADQDRKRSGTGKQENSSRPRKKKQNRLPTS